MTDADHILGLLLSYNYHQFSCFNVHYLDKRFHKTDWDQLTHQLSISLHFDDLSNLMSSSWLSNYHYVLYLWNWKPIM